MQVIADDLHPDASIQYVALYLIQELNRRGKVQGNLPARLFDPDEKRLLNDILRRGVPFSDLEIEAALVGVTLMLRDQGIDIEFSTSDAMKELKR